MNRYTSLLMLLGVRARRVLTQTRDKSLAADPHPRATPANTVRSPIGASCTRMWTNRGSCNSIRVRDPLFRGSLYACYCVRFGVFSRRVRLDEGRLRMRASSHPKQGIGQYPL